ncbi:MAG: hypothetical protein L3J04_02975 [Robiginitomaculum sp.]|nr:hypothetical protein [Robiginitomaculum sp.]
MSNFVEYIPILTTFGAIFFAREIFLHYRKSKTTYLMWWTIGVIAFGLGTLSESINVLFGWSEINTKFWYIVGALLGGFPLAQGSVYLLMNRKFAHATTILIVSTIVIAAVFVALSPIALPTGFEGKLTGRVFEWQWIRLFSIPINIYAMIFLVGGAIYSALKYYALSDHQARFKGNVYIAIGALLPGIGGTFTRMGHVEVLYVTELIGLFLIYVGYKIIKSNNQQNKIDSTQS